jgi:hypothetical protein
MIQSDATALEICFEQSETVARSALRIKMRRQIDFERACGGIDSVRAEQRDAKRNEERSGHRTPSILRSVFLSTSDALIS